MLGVLLPSSRRVDGWGGCVDSMAIAASPRHRAKRDAGKEVVRTRMEQLQALEDAQDAAASAKKPVPEPVSEKKEDEGPRRIKARDRDERCAACRCEARGSFAASFPAVSDAIAATRATHRHGADVRAHVRQGY